MRCRYIDTSRVSVRIQRSQRVQLIAVFAGGAVYIPWLSPTNEHGKFEERFGPFRIRLQGLLKEERGSDSSTLRETQNPFEGAFVLDDIVEKAMRLANLIFVWECRVKTTVRGWVQMADFWIWF